MARDGKKIEEFEMYPCDARGNRTSASHRATLRMTDGFKFILEVNQLRFEGRTPTDLIQQAQMQLENEQDLKWIPIILVDPDLDEGRLVFRRIFTARSKDGRDVYRVWRFSGDDERQIAKWDHKIPATFSHTEGAVPGDRADGPRLKDREMEYSPERWESLVKLDQVLGEAHKAVADRLSEIIRKGNLDTFLKRTTSNATPRLIFDEATRP